MGRLAILAASAVLLVGLTGCAPESIEVTAGTVVVDVRTGAEFAGGHLAGAINIDLRGSDFETRIADLPRDGRYLVYCASGNRSSSAVATMADLGFAEVIDGGGISDAARSTGLDVVTGE